MKNEIITHFYPKSCGHLLNVEPSNLVFLKTSNAEFDIIITFTNQFGRPFEIEE